MFTQKFTLTNSQSITKLGANVNICSKLLQNRNVKLNTRHLCSYCPLVTKTNKRIVWRANYTFMIWRLNYVIPPLRPSQKFSTLTEVVSFFWTHLIPTKVHFPSFLLMVIQIPWKYNETHSLAGCEGQWTELWSNNLIKLSYLVYQFFIRNKAQQLKQGWVKNVQYQNEKSKIENDKDGNEAWLNSPVSSFIAGFE